MLLGPQFPLWFSETGWSRQHNQAVQSTTFIFSQLPGEAGRARHIIPILQMRKLRPVRQWLTQGCHPQLPRILLHSPGDSEMCSLDPAFLINGSLSSCQLSGALARLTASVSAADAWIPTFLGCDREHTRNPGWGRPKGFRLAATPGA